MIPTSLSSRPTSIRDERHSRCSPCNHLFPKPSFLGGHWMLHFFVCLFLAHLPTLPGATPETVVRETEIRKHSEKLEFLPLEHDSSGRAVIRFIDPFTHFFLSNGYRYFGFRFKTPQALEGALSWMFLLRNPDGPMSLGQLHWGILRRNGEPMQGFSSFMSRRVNAYPDLKTRFPHTQDLMIQYLSRKNLLPDEEYVIWFRIFENEKSPEVAVAFSFMDSGQQNPQAKLPLTETAGLKAAGGKTNTDVTSLDGDPW